MATLTLTALDTGVSVEEVVTNTAADIIAMMQDYPTQTYLKLDDGAGSFVYINRNQIIKIV